MQEPNSHKNQKDKYIFQLQNQSIEAVPSFENISDQNSSKNILKQNNVHTAKQNSHKTIEENFSEILPLSESLHGDFDAPVFMDWQRGEDETWKIYHQEQAQKEAEQQKLKVYSLIELMQLELPQKEYVLYPIIPQKGLVMTYASRGVGKTHLALNIAYAVASGASFLKWHASKAQKVLYIDGEMPVHAIQERLAGIIASSDFEPPEGYFNILTPDVQNECVFMPNLATKEGQEAIEPYLEDVKLVIVDNLATLCRHGRANEEESFIPVQEWILKLRRKGLSVLLVHHASKNGSQRGTSSKEDVLDTVIQLIHPKDYKAEEGARFEVHYTKARGLCGEEAEPFEAQLSTLNGLATWTVKNIEDLIIEKVKAMAEDGMTQREIAIELGKGLGTISRLCKSNNIVTGGGKK